MDYKDKEYHRQKAKKPKSIIGPTKKSTTNVVRNKKPGHGYC